MSTENIVIRIIEPNDYENIIEFLRINFYRDEPLSMGMEPKHERASNVELTMKHIVDGTCLMAVEQSGKDEVILGVAMAGPKNPNEANRLFEEAAKVGPSKLGHILLLLACIERDANVFKRFDVSKALHVHAVCVDGNKRGHSITILLEKKLKELGRQLGYPLMTSDCTSLYSARICAKMGWECVHTVRYDEYLDHEGKQIFCPPAPHECVKTYVIQL